MITWDKKSSNSYLYSDNNPSLSLTYGKTPSTSDTPVSLLFEVALDVLTIITKKKYLFELSGRYDGTSRFFKKMYVISSIQVLLPHG